MGANIVDVKEANRVQNNLSGNLSDTVATVYINSDKHVSCKVLAYSKQRAELLNEFPVPELHSGCTLTLSIHMGKDTLTRKAVISSVNNNSSEQYFDVEFSNRTLDPAHHQLDVTKIRIDPVCTLRIPGAIALRRKILPFLKVDDVLHVACANMKNASGSGSIERMLKAPVCLWDADAEKLDAVLKQIYGKSSQQQVTAKSAKTTEQSSGIADLGDSLLYAALIREASDIHIDPGHKGARIRFRVDGQLELYDQIKADVYTELSSRIKVLAGLDIAEKRAPQDGRFSYAVPGGGRRVDIRTATLPTKYGERMTLRLLAVQTASLTLDKLGFGAIQKKAIEDFLGRLQGMMILTGPTGSGKTTTLYASIRLLLQQRNVNIITVEDPIEYEIDGVAQCEVDNTSDKVDFAKALRSILRHDPDVVMIGEIRDKETADIAIKASLTGHMVFGTLHTNSAAATITRLIDMGVEPYLVAAALRLTVAQRLLRRLCQFCCISRPLTEREAVSLMQPDLKGTLVYEACGCVYCGNKGYSGRIGLYELLELNEQWARSIAEGENEGDLLSKIRKAGVKSLLENAIDKLVEGETSYQEVLQIASSW